MMAAEETTRKAVAVGPALGRLLDIARDAGLAALLVGRHGIGKSEFVTSWARQRGMKTYVLDLSLLEATDLTGIPYIASGTTRFAPPAILPPTDAAEPTVLLLEELNRCDRSVRQPCLQLLTTRRLNEYRLPEGCFVAACVNPTNAGYDVDELDDALASRFASIAVAADRDAWLSWARSSEVPEFLVAFVERYRQAFDTHPPRTWAFAGRIAAAAIARGAHAEDLERALRMVLGNVAAQALVLELRDRGSALPGPAEILRDPRKHVAAVRTLTDERRLDVLREMVGGLCELLDVAQGRAALRLQVTRDALLDLLAVMPPDMATPVKRRLAEG